jgi:hypothetical protein
MEMSAVPVSEMERDFDSVKEADSSPVSVKVADLVKVRDFE